MYIVKCNNAQTIWIKLLGERNLMQALTWENAVPNGCKNEKPGDSDRVFT